MSVVQATESATAADKTRTLQFSRFAGIGNKKAKILLIDDEMKMSLLLRTALEGRFNCQIDIAADPYEAMNVLTENYFDLVILDWRLPALSGGQTLAACEKGLFFEPDLPLQWDQKKVPVVVFSGSEKDACFFERTAHFKCVGFISKNQPFKGMIDSFGQFLKERTLKKIG